MAIYTEKKATAVTSSNSNLSFKSNMNHPENADNQDSLNAEINRETFKDFDAFKEFIKDMFINGSGIDPVIFETCIEFHESLEYGYGGDVSSPIHDELDWKYPRFTRECKEAFYAAFLRNEDGTLWQAIVSLWDKDKERPYRYLAPKKPESAPKGYGNRAYLPPIPELIRNRIGSKYGVDVPLTGSFWKWLETQDKLPRIITEGGKKSLLGLTEGYIAIALYGCTCGVIDEDKKGNKIAPKPIPDLSRFAIENTCWLLAFDRDEKEKAKTAVSFGKKRLINALARDAKCFVEDIFWKPEQGKGWDDLVVNSGDGAFNNAYSRAVARLEKQFKSNGLLLEDIETGKKPPADKIAQKIAEDYRHMLRFNNETSQWMRYEADYPGVWSPETDDFMDSLVYEIINSEGIQGYSAAYISSVAKLLRHQLIARKWNERRDVLPFINGVLEVETGKLMPHNPNYLLTWQLPREYNVTSKDWSTIDQFLDHLSGNNPKIKDLLLCYCNAVVKGRSDLQKFLHLIGIGGTGKGSFSRLVVNLIGQQNVLVTTLEDWCTNRFEGANAYSKRLVLFPDEDKQTGRIGKFLSLTGEDYIRAEEKGKKAFQYRFEGMSMVLSNFPIFTGDSANRIKRRAITVPCNNPVTTINRRLEADFESELTAFTNYVINIPDETVTEVLSGIEKVPECTLEFWENRCQVDSIAAWLNQHVIFDPLAEIAVGFDRNEGDDGHANYTLFGSYNKHCKSVGDAAKSHKRFSPELMELCKSVLRWDVEKHVTKTGKYIKGLRLRQIGIDDGIPTHDYFLMQKVLDNIALYPSPTVNPGQRIDPEPSPYPSPEPSPPQYSDYEPENKKIHSNIALYPSPTVNPGQCIDPEPSPYPSPYPSPLKNAENLEHLSTENKKVKYDSSNEHAHTGDGSGDGLGDGSEPSPRPGLTEGDGLNPILSEIFSKSIFENLSTENKKVKYDSSNEHDNTGDGSGDGLGDGSEPSPRPGLTEGDGLNPILSEIFSKSIFENLESLPTETKKVKYASPCGGEIKAVTFPINDETWQFNLMYPDGTESQHTKKFPVDLEAKKIRVTSSEKATKHLKQLAQRWINKLRFKVTRLCGVGQVETIENCKFVYKNSGFKGSQWIFETPTGMNISVFNPSDFEVQT